ncbi:MAG: hypothetical protein Q7O66_09420 [Dehalococcoidia bacterium]|nr:hypothetical protein [Dehalococcoidia bacterium]
MLKAALHRNRGSLIVFVAVLLCYLVLLPYRIDTLRPLPIPVPVPTGDEPYYLEMAHSLIYHHTLDLTETHDVQGDYWRFYPYELGPHQSQTTIAGHYSKHQPGLAVLIAPFYWIGDQFWLGEVTGSRAVVAAFMCFLTALLAANIYLLARESGASNRVAFYVTAIMAATNPLLSYAFLIFPEIPAALCTIYVFRRARLGNDGPYRALIAGLALALLPWLHSRFAFIVLPLTIFYLFGNHQFSRRKIRGLALFVGPLAVGSVGFLGLNYHLYTSLMPNTQDHAGFVGLGGVVAALTGQLVDQQWGLLIYAPIYVLVFSGLILILRRWRSAGADGSQAGRDVLWLLAVSVPYLVMISFYRQWWGEWCPPGRYLVAILPLLTLPLVAAVQAAARTTFGRTVQALLLIPSLAVSAAFVADPILMYNHPLGKASLLSAASSYVGVDLTVFAPAIVYPNELSMPLTIAWLVFFGGITMMLIAKGET